MKKESQTIKLLIQECNDLKKRLSQVESDRDYMESEFRAAMEALKLVSVHSLWNWNA